MSELTWRDAIIRVLKGQSEPMHYTDIAQEIAERALRTTFGATPVATVNAAMSESILKEGQQSPFVRVARGFYALRDASLTQESPTESVDDPDQGLINAFGMYWARSNVLWTSKPRLLGQQQVGSTRIDFCDQRGVYLLHDRRSVVYVGRAVDQPLGVRLKQHVHDRLNGRWDRFSWFGVYLVSNDGTLDTTGGETYRVDLFIATVEALLIESLEPPQNRKSGDGFQGVEFLQVEDPEIQKRQVIQLMDELKSKL